MFELPHVPDDTDEQIKIKMISLLRDMPLEKKLSRALDLSELARNFILENIKLENPLLSKNEIKAEFANRLYGQELGKSIAQLYKK